VQGVESLHGKKAHAHLSLGGGKDSTRGRKGAQNWGKEKNANEKGRPRINTLKGGPGIRGRE